MMSPSPKRQRIKDFPFRNEATLPDWWLELTPHHTLNLEDERARRDAEDRMTLHYAELAAADAKNGKMCDVDGHPLAGDETKNNNSSSAQGGGITRRWSGRNNSNNGQTNQNDNGHSSKMFGGRNFQPGSPGWDARQWGIDDQDSDFESYQTGNKLPPEYVTAMTNYAKATGQYRDVNDNASHVTLRSTQNSQYGRVGEKPAFEPEFMKVKLRSRKNWRTAGSAIMATKRLSPSEKQETTVDDTVEESSKQQTAPIITEAKPEQEDEAASAPALPQSEESQTQVLERHEVTPAKDEEFEFEEEVIEEEEEEEEIIIEEEENLDDLENEIVHMIEQEEEIPELKFADPSPEKQAIFRQMRRGSAVATPPSKVQARNVPRTISNDFQEGGEVVEYNPEDGSTNDYQGQTYQYDSYAGEEENTDMLSYVHSNTDVSKQMRRGSAVAALPPNWKPRLENPDRRDSMTRAISQDFVEGGEVVEAQYHTTSIEEAEDEGDESHNAEVAQATRNAQPFEREAVISTPTKSNQRNNQQPIERIGDHPAFLENTHEQTARSRATPREGDGWNTMTTEEKRSRARLLAMYYAELASHDEEEGKACDVSGIPIQSKKRRQRWASPSRRRSRSRTPETPRRSWRAFSSDKQRSQTPDRRVAGLDARESRGRSRSPRRQRAQTTGRHRNATPSRNRRFWFFGRKRSKMFGGLVYKPESKDWDPSNWGIDWTHPEYDYHLTTEYLPHDYVKAMYNYAKLTGKSVPFHDELLGAYLNSNASGPKDQVQSQGITIVENQASSPQKISQASAEAEPRKANKNHLSEEQHAHQTETNNVTLPAEKDYMEEDPNNHPDGVKNDSLLGQRVINKEPALDVSQNEEISVEPAIELSETRHETQSAVETKDHMPEGIRSIAQLSDASQEIDPKTVSVDTAPKEGKDSTYASVQLRAPTSQMKATSEPKKAPWIKDEPKDGMNNVKSKSTSTPESEAEVNAKASLPQKKWQQRNNARPRGTSNFRPAPWQNKLEAPQSPPETKTQYKTQDAQKSIRGASEPNDPLVIIPPKTSESPQSDVHAPKRTPWQKKVYEAASSSTTTQKPSPLRKRAAWEKPLDTNNQQAESNERSAPWVKNKNTPNQSPVRSRPSWQNPKPSATEVTDDKEGDAPTTSPPPKKQWQKPNSSINTTSTPGRAPWQKPKSEAAKSEIQSTKPAPGEKSNLTEPSSKKTWQRPTPATTPNSYKAPWAKDHAAAPESVTHLNKPSWQKPKQSASPDTSSPGDTMELNRSPADSASSAIANKPSWVKSQTDTSAPKRAPWEKSEAASASHPVPEQRPVSCAGSGKADYFSKFSSADNGIADTDDDEEFIEEEIVESEGDESYIEVEVSDSEFVEEVIETEHEEEIIEPPSPKSRWGARVGV